MKCVATRVAFADAHMAKHMHPVPAQTFVLCTKHIIRCAMQQTAPMLAGGTFDNRVMSQLAQTVRCVSL